jgi:hypothetical protein
VSSCGHGSSGSRPPRVSSPNYYVPQECVSSSFAVGLAARGGPVGRGGRPSRQARPPVAAPPPHGGRGGESGGSGLSRSARRRSEVRHEWMNWERSIMSRDNSLASWVRGWTVKPRCSLSVSKQTGTAPCAIQSGRRGSAFDSSVCIVQKHVMYGTGRCLWSARRGSLARAWLIFF